ncbi:hypothetical protein, partial [Bartonella sp. AC330YNZD]|uniref:hypothetical protein n=1 Tax=Bartonella sp. AC330YNZD TaxID=3243453 RepID=UPI0035D12F52
NMRAGLSSSSGIFTFVRGHVIFLTADAFAVFLGIPHVFDSPFVLAIYYDSVTKIKISKN